MKKKYLISLIPVFAMSLGIAAAGCKNPADGKSKAEVGEAKPITEAPTGEGVAKVLLTSENSKITWKGSKVTGHHDGGFKGFSGTVSAQNGDPLKARIDLTIDMRTIYSDNEKLTGHLKNDDFFSVDKHPEARFVSSSITAGGKDGASHTISGNLTMRGVTKGVAFPATVKISEGEVVASAEFVINRRDWGINYDGMKDDLIRNEVVLKLDIKAPRGK